MNYIADLHIHSKYSRATAKNLDLENIYIAAKMKGIQVVATGDFTHPQWFDELQAKLVPAEPGLYRLRADLEQACNAKVPRACTGEVRFILESEISCIYKKDGKTRKNHNLVFMPDLASALRFNTKLDAIGNIKSDGRPILGLDARNLLELLLETNDDGFLIPAHIWTPWFSMLGSKSGFDTMTDCFGDLAPHIFAAETGLSSDPAMNGRVSFLDTIALVSNSDAHSPAKLGREANLFDTELSYYAMKSALETRDKNHFTGTYEFFPEEGKYHMDGHRKCGVCFTPEDSVRHDTLCPVCGKPVTLGVSYRINELADRDETEKPPGVQMFKSIIPLEEIISELAGTGVKSKKVNRALMHVLETIGTEFDILNTIPVEEFGKASIPMLDEAITRMRQNSVFLRPGFDGEFGVIRLFGEDEKTELSGQKLLFPVMSVGAGEEKGFFKAGVSAQTPVKISDNKETRAHEKKTGELIADPRQESAVVCNTDKLIIQAGPGTGKTHTLIRRMAEILTTTRVPPESLLAITFTIKAAGELKQRLAALTTASARLPVAQTFHSLGMTLLQDAGREVTVIDQDTKARLVEQAMAQVTPDKPIKQTEVRRCIAAIDTLKQDPGFPAGCDQIDPPYGDIARAYQALLAADNLVDYDDLILQPLQHLESDPSFQAAVRARYRYIFVDEYQDLNRAQYRLLQAITGPATGLTVIGDPDQAIYGFRGSDPAFFLTFTDDYKEATPITLSNNYRSAQTLLDAAADVLQIPPQQACAGITGDKMITLLENASSAAEAVAIGKKIEHLMGGVDFASVDFGKLHDKSHDAGLSFSDFAILARTAAVCREIVDALEAYGIPCQFAATDAFYRQDVIAQSLGCLKQAKKDGHAPPVGSAMVALDAKTRSRIQTETDTRGIKAALMALRQESPEIDALAAADPKSEDAFAKLLTIADPFQTDYHDFCKTIALHTDTDLYDHTVEKVAVMTIHASKGLEFNTVFIAGCEDGLLPFYKDGTPCESLEEERRLLYVGMTRAEKRLFLSYAKNRRIFGKKTPRSLSAFIKKIDNRRIRYENTTVYKPPEPPRPKQLSLF